MTAGLAPLAAAGLPALIAAALGPTGFAALAWGSILLVLGAFVYVVWALVAGRKDEQPARSSRGSGSDAEG